MTRLFSFAAVSVGMGLFVGLAPSVANAQLSGTKAQKVPAALVDVGEFGENVYDHAKADEWAKAAKKFEELQAAAKQLSDVKDAKGEKKRLDTILVALAKAIAAKDRLATMREANLVTQIAADLTEPFNPQVPAAVTRLDFYGRELEIGVAAKEKDRLKAAATGLRTTWDKVRPAVKTRGGDAEAKRFDALVAQVEAAKSVDDYSRLVTPILDEVDNLEKVFKK
jgi:hypothetical protein